MTFSCAKGANRLTRRSAVATDILGDMLRGCTIRAWQYHCKFITAISSGHIDRSMESGRQCSGDCCQVLVAGPVNILVIDCFEEIHSQDRRYPLSMESASYRRSFDWSNIPIRPRLSFFSRYRATSAHFMS